MRGKKNDSPRGYGGRLGPILTVPAYRVKAGQLTSQKIRRNLPVHFSQNRLDMGIVEPPHLGDLACKGMDSPGSCYVVKWIEGKYFVLPSIRMYSKLGFADEAPTRRQYTISMREISFTR